MVDEHLASQWLRVKSNQKTGSLRGGWLKEHTNRQHPRKTNRLYSIQTMESSVWSLSIAEGDATGSMGAMGQDAGLNSADPEGTHSWDVPCYGLDCRETGETMLGTLGNKAHQYFYLWNNRKYHHAVLYSSICGSQVSHNVWPNVSPAKCHWNKINEEHL